jgi:hypothetical protein
MRKGKDLDPDLWLMDPDPGGTKICSSLFSLIRSVTYRNKQRKAEARYN